MHRIGIILVALLVALSIRANERSDSEESKSRELPELDVTSVKQVGSLEDQPVSATILGQQEITLNDISDIKSISDLVPNLYIPNYGSRITSTIYVRGIGARMDQPVIGLNIDNLPVLNKDAYDLHIPDIALIQMLRGPQSILYGRNTMGGVININTLSPMQFQGWKLMGEVFSGFSFRLNGGWYHKFNPNTALSTSLSINSIRGRYKNEYNDTPVGTEKSGSVRLKFEWKPSRTFSLTNTLSSSTVRQSGYAYEYVSSGEINYNDTCFYRRFLLNDALTLRFALPEWSLTSISSVQYLNDNMTLDQDFLPSPYFTLTQRKKEVIVTEELLARRALGHKYNWLVGAFAFYRHMDMNAPVTFKDTGIDALIETHRNEANPYYPIRWNSRDFVLNSVFTLPSFGLALYHESSFTAGQWTFTAALRLDYEKIMMDYRSFTTTAYTIYSNPTGDYPVNFDHLTPWRTVPIDIDDSGKISTDFLTLLPKVTVLYQLPSIEGNVYANFGKGYKAGGFNTNMFSDVLQQRLMSLMGFGGIYSPEEIIKYKPEYSFNYEVGSHIDFSKYLSQGKSLILDLSLFYIDCRDQQLTIYPDGTTTGRMMTNAGKTRSFGAELSVTAIPYTPLQISASYGYTNARFVRFSDGISDFKGKRLPYSPANTLFVQGIYTFSGNSLGDNSVILEVNMKGTGNIYWNEANTLRQPFYALLGASVTFKRPKWEVQLWGRNLTATKYHTFYFMSMGNEFIQRGEKITFGATFRINL